MYDLVWESADPAEVVLVEKTAFREVAGRLPHVKEGGLLMNLAEVETWKLDDCGWTGRTAENPLGNPEFYPVVRGNGQLMCTSFLCIMADQQDTNWIIGFPSSSRIL